MNILFVHGNYPGQFLNLAPYLSNKGHKVVFLTESDNPQNISLAGVTLCQFSASFRNDLVKTATHQQAAFLRAQYVSLAISRLSENGFDVDLMIIHGGQGYGLLPRSLHSNIKVLLYVEWFFTESLSKHIFREYNLTSWAQCEAMNMPLLRESHRLPKESS